MPRFRNSYASKGGLLAMQKTAHCIFILFLSLLPQGKNYFSASLGAYGSKKAWK